MIRDGTRTAAGPVPATPYSRSDLNAVSGSTVAGFSGTATGRGWYQDAIDPKQKITTDVFADVQTVVYAFSKGTDDPCLGNLQSTLYARDFTTGNSVLAIRWRGGGSKRRHRRHFRHSADPGHCRGREHAGHDDRGFEAPGGIKGQVFSFGVRLTGGANLKHRVSWRLLNRD